MHRNKHLVVIGVLLFVVAWGIWCTFFLPRGLEPNHEGWYFSEAWRLAQGDLPFRDSSSLSVTLVPWWASLVLRIYPECSLLGLRIVWAIMMSLCALVTFKLMLRFFNPLVSFTGAAASLLFIDAVTYIRAPSYNATPALPLLLAVSLWVIASHRSGKVQLFLAAGAGAAAFLATTCRIALVVVIFLPILTMVYDHCCGVKVDGLRRMAITFFVTYLAGVLCFLLAVGSMGLTGDLFNGWTIFESEAGHGLGPLAHMMIWSSLFILLPALVVVLIAASFRYREELMLFSARHKEAIKHSIPIIVACMLSIGILGWFYLYALDGRLWPGELVRLLIENRLYSVVWPFFIAATGVILADVIFHPLNHVFNVKTGEDVARTHNRCRLGIIAIFLCLATILGTGEFPPMQPVWLNAWLLISLAVGLCCVWLADWSKYLTKLRFVWRLRVVCIVFLLISLCYGIGRHCYPWGDGPIWELSTSPKTARLHAIFTTPERADLMESVVDAVERNSQVGDRILVYYDNPWVYCLTNRLPSTYMTWLAYWTTNSPRQSALDDMIERDRLPKVVVYFPTGGWGIEPLVPNDPIHEYVKEHYEVVEEIGEVKIMLPIATIKDKDH